MIGVSHFQLHTHDTASLRLSWTLNRFGGRHALGTEPYFLSKRGVDSVNGGQDDQQYIFRNTAFGPYLAKKYGDPQVLKPDQINVLQGRQGIVRFVNYRTKKHRHPSGHIALWDCTHFYQSKNWTISSDQPISIEFWETPGKISDV